MNLPIKVSIITICKNSAPSIENAIKSVINQSYQNIEYIIIDGNSTDNTLSIINKYQSKISQFISEEDNGISDAFNKGISISSGDLIGFLNADDTYIENAIEILVEHYLLNKNEADIIYGDCLCHTNNKNKYIVRAGYPIDFNLRTPFLCHQAVLIKSAIFQTIGNFDINLKYGMDYDWFLRSYNAGFKFYYIGATPIINYSQGGFTAKNSNRALIEFYKIAKRNLKDISNLKIYYAQKIIKNTFQEFLFKLGLKKVIIYIKSKLYNQYSYYDS